MSATCKACGSDQTFLRMRMSDDQQQAFWTMECLSCGIGLSGVMTVNTTPDDVKAKVAKMFDTGDGQA